MSLINKIIIYVGRIIFKWTYSMNCSGKTIIKLVRLKSFGLVTLALEYIWMSLFLFVCIKPFCLVLTIKFEEYLK